MNHGEERDYRALEVIGVSVRGCLVLARKGETLGRGVVVKIAETKGALGVLIYDEKDGGALGGIERGTVMRGIGDPVSPGWPGVVGGEKLSLDDDRVSRRFPKIPSLPLSLHNAEIILASLGGARAPVEWRSGRVGSSQRVGPGRVVVNMTLQVKPLCLFLGFDFFFFGSETPLVLYFEGGDEDEEDSQCCGYNKR